MNFTDFLESKSIKLTESDQDKKMFNSKAFKVVQKELVKVGIELNELKLEYDETDDSITNIIFRATNIGDSIVHENGIPIVEIDEVYSNNDIFNVKLSFKNNISPANFAQNTSKYIANLNKVLNKIDKYLRNKNDHLNDFYIEGDELNYWG